MAFTGAWKRTSTDGAEAFFAAFEPKPENAEKLRKAALAEMVTNITDNGTNITLSRTLTLGRYFFIIVYKLTVFNFCPFLPIFFRIFEKILSR